ncbi:alpha/beta hydrolase [Streptomyces sp. NPDC051639]|uniref:alpha/beta hydrolase n=1 Tax=unclassified Streptomyces TaxID=2593676 RepID=UPI002E32AA57|nr:alpha/beta hydrolase [Streptomyces sp. NBC_01455]
MVSTLTWQQLRDLKLSELSDAADGWSGVSRHADSARERVDGQMSGALARTQESESARAAVKRLRRLSDNYHYIRTESGLIRGAVDGLASELASPRRNLREALDDAAALGYTVDEDGGVGYPAGGKDELTGDEIPGGTVGGNNGLLGSGNPGLYPADKNGLYQPGMGAGAAGLKSPNPYRVKAQEVADRIAHALREAQEIDVRYSEALRKLKAAPGLTVEAMTWADVAADVDSVSSAASDYIADHIPLDKSPADRKEWWDHLSDAEREEYKTAFPEIIGNLDGMPAVVRDEVNRENLQMLIAKLEGQHDEISRDQLASMKGIEHKLSLPSNPPMFLLGIGDEGNGRAIVSYGNPDTAKNVSAYVPGLGTTLNSEFAGSTLDRGLNTAKGAIVYSRSSAAIVWLGYDAPGLVEVGSTTSAERGARAYSGFMDGLKATNDQRDPHVTAIGHSYGSLAVGTAARQHGGIPGVDDIILLGSPGAGAERASELNVGREHVFVGSAGNDPVTRLPSKPQAAAVLLGGPVLGTLADPGGDDLWFGKDPASKAFGATRFRVSDGPLPFGLSGEGMTPAHSDYFTPAVDPTHVGPREDPESARNIAKIVAGRSDKITTEVPR